MEAAPVYLFSYSVYSIRNNDSVIIIGIKDIRGEDMIDFYNAFISYRHADLDSRVAEHVQRNLERFHIPHKLRQKVGKKKIERIFRDKDELPITADLTDTISNALEKAEYLIVICSPNTKESVWVKREIEYFLRNHTKKEVLTVLAGGEPEEVIPDILKHDVRKVRGEDGKEIEVDTAVEPLSCDYRMPFGRAKKEELPRLAAALIGCSYDELVRRQRAYRIRRAAIAGGLVLAAAIAFGAYMAYGKEKINSAYQEALVQRSKYLAIESNNRLKEDDRIDALFLALEALPKEEGDGKPVTAEALSSLSEATLAYKGVRGWSIEPVWKYELQNQIRDFCICPDGSKLAALDSSLAVYFWNTEDHSIFFEYKDPDINVSNVYFADNDVAVIVASRTYIAVDVKEGKVIWQLENESGFVDTPPMVIENHILLVNKQDELIAADIKTGEVKKTYNIAVKSGEDPVTYRTFAVSSDKKKIGFTGFVGADSYFVGNIDLDSGKIVLNEATNRPAKDILWAEDGSLIAADTIVDKSASYRMDDTSVLRPGGTCITCYEPGDMKVRWQKEFDFSAVLENMRLVEMGESVAYYEGNKCTVYNVADGEVLYDWDAAESIVFVNFKKGDDYPLIMTRDGYMATPWLAQGNNVLSSSLTLADKIRQMEVNRGIYVRRSYSSDILYYKASVSDDEWEQTPDIQYDYMSDSYMDDNVIVLILIDDEGASLYMIDPVTNKLIRRDVLIPGEKTAPGYRILGADEKNVYVLCSKTEGVFVMSFPLDGGQKSEEQIYDKYVASQTLGFVNEGTTSVLDFGMDKGELVTYDFINKKREVYDINIENKTVLKIAPQYYKAINKAYIAGSDRDFIHDTASGTDTKVDLPSDWEGTSKIVYSPELSGFLVCDGRKIILVKPDGSIGLDIYCDGKIPLGYAVNKDPSSDKNVIYAAYSEGNLVRYDTDTGKIIASSRISNYYNAKPNAEFVFDFANKTLYIHMQELISVVDMDSWVETAYIENSIGRHIPTDRFYTTSQPSRDSVIGYFRHYDLADLIAKAKKMLGGQEMSDDMRGEYGI